MAQRRQLLGHVAVDVRIADREDQDETEQRDREERHRGLGEADHEPRPAGVHDLLDGGKRDAAGGEASEVDPVDLEEVPGAVRTRAGQALEEQDESEDREPCPDAQEEVVAAGQGGGDEALTQTGVVHHFGPPAAADAGAAAATPCSFRTWFTIAQRSIGSYTLSP